MSYLAVDDVDARVKKAIAAGAKLMKPIFDVPDVGRIADPDRAGRCRRRLDDAGRLINERKEFSMQPHKIVPQDEWIAARKAFLETEKRFTKARDELSRQRRELPWVKVDKRYLFDGPSGQETLAGLFGGRSQLIVYHFMFGPDWEQAAELLVPFRSFRRSHRSPRTARRHHAGDLARTAAAD